MIQLRTLVPALAVAFILTAGLSAHEGHIHYVMGTVKTVSADHIVVTTTDAKTHKAKDVSVALNAKTRYRRGEASMAHATLKPGERVVVSVGDGKEPLKAVEIRLP